MIKLGCDYLDSFAGFDEKSELYLWQIEPWSNIPLKSVIRTWNNGLVGNFEFDDWSNGVFKCYFSKHNNDGTNSRTLEPEGVGFAVGFCIMRCSNDDKDFDRTIMCVDDVFWAYCLMMKRTFYSNVCDRDFKQNFLVDENKHYLYTKERLFKYFDKKTCDMLTNYTRNLFDFAKEHNFVGEFIEDVKESAIDTGEVKDVISIKLDKVKKILDLLCIEWKIKGKTNSFIPYSKAKINYLKAYLEDYLNDEKIENYSPITTDDAAADYRNYAMESCFNVLYPTSEEQDKNKQKWQKMFCLIFNLSADTWRKGRSRKPSDNAFIEAVDGIVYEIKKKKIGISNLISR